jgi:hypothetical protein
MKGRCFLIGCELEGDARKLMAVLPKRFARFGLTMHPTKTALIAFRQPEDPQGADSGNGTFTFLGLTHYWTKSRRGFWVIKRRTARKRLRRTNLGLTHYWTKSRRGFWVIKRRTARKRLRRTKESLWRWCRTHRHAPLQYQYQMRCAKLRGHCQYYGIRGNFRLREEVRRFAEKAWRYWLSRRSSKSAIGGGKFEKLMQTSIRPIPRIVHNI